jgi:hypothetical protein
VYRYARSVLEVLDPRGRVAERRREGLVAARRPAAVVLLGNGKPNVDVAFAETAERLRRALGATAEVVSKPSMAHGCPAELLERVARGAELAVVGIGD